MGGVLVLARCGRIKSFDGLGVHARGSVMRGCRSGRGIIVSRIKI
jgi:hypothetical protein